MLKWPILSLKRTIANELNQFIHEYSDKGLWTEVEMKFSSFVQEPEFKDAKNPNPFSKTKVQPFMGVNKLKIEIPGG